MKKTQSFYCNGFTGHKGLNLGIVGITRMGKHWVKMFFFPESKHLNISLAARFLFLQEIVED